MLVPGDSVMFFWEGDRVAELDHRLTEMEDDWYEATGIPFEIWEAWTEDDHYVILLRWEGQPEWKVEVFE